MESPWLTPKEAAQYCKLGLSLFNQFRRKLPIETGGTARRPRFHKEELDHWMRKMFRPPNDTLDEVNKQERLIEEEQVFEQYPLKTNEAEYKANALR